MQSYKSLPALQQIHVGGVQEITFASCLDKLYAGPVEQLYANHHNIRTINVVSTCIDYSRVKGEGTNLPTLESTVKKFVGVLVNLCPNLKTAMEQSDSWNDTFSELIHKMNLPVNVCS